MFLRLGDIECLSWFNRKHPFTTNYVPLRLGPNTTRSSEGNLLREPLGGDPRGNGSDDGTNPYLEPIAVSNRKYEPL